MKTIGWYWDKLSLSEREYLLNIIALSTGKPIGMERLPFFNTKDAYWLLFHNRIDDNYNVVHAQRIMQVLYDPAFHLDRHYKDVDWKFSQ